jgi:hypothetical protein
MLSKRIWNIIWRLVSCPLSDSLSPRPLSLQFIDGDDAMTGMESEEYNLYEELELDALSLGGIGGFGGKADDGDEKEDSDDKGDDAAPVEELPSPPSLVATISSGAKPKKVATVPQSLVAPNPPPVATAAAAKAPPSTAASAGSKTAAAIVAGSSAKAAAGSKQSPAPSTQKSAPTAAAIVAGNLPTNPPPTSAAAAAKAPAMTAAKIVSGDKKATPAGKATEGKSGADSPLLTSHPLSTQVEKTQVDLLRWFQRRRWLGHGLMQQLVDRELPVESTASPLLNQIRLQSNPPLLLQLCRLWKSCHKLPPLLSNLSTLLRPVSKKRFWPLQPSQLRLRFLLPNPPRLLVLKAQHRQDQVPLLSLRTLNQVPHWQRSQPPRQCCAH